jgi:diguanylate cyclase (GGDEF)-like protein
MSSPTEPSSGQSATAAEPTGRSPKMLGRLKRAATGAPAPPAPEKPTVLDPVTGLPVRDHLHDWVDRAVRRSLPTSSRVVVAFVSVGLLRDVNDTYGADRGDALLRAIGERLSSVDLPGTRVLRHEGAEFALIFEKLDQIHANEEIARFLVDLLGEPFEVGDDSITVSPSVGTAISGDRYADVDDLVRDAHRSLARARDEGTHWESYDETKRGRYETRIDEVRLRHAIEDDEFVLHYQPIVGTDSGALVGFEALLRWKAPGATNAGVLFPSDFMPMLEKTGMSVVVGRWALNEACHQIAEWNARGPRAEPLFVTTNVSSRHLADAKFADHVTEAVRGSGIDAGWLCLDLTEQALRFNGTDAWPPLRDLTTTGVKLSLDDFGTGVTSLHWLLELSLDFMRIERSFVTQLGTNVNNVERGLPDQVGVILRHLKAMADELGIQVIAEGVESADEVKAVELLGIPLAQGYHYGHAESAEVATARVDPDQERSTTWDANNVMENPVVEPSDDDG